MKYQICNLCGRLIELQSDKYEEVRSGVITYYAHSDCNDLIIKSRPSAINPQKGYNDQLPTPKGCGLAGKS
mgnify:CR=1 FL=1